MAETKSKSTFKRVSPRVATRWELAFEVAGQHIATLDELMTDYADAWSAGAFAGPDYTDAEREAVRRVVCCFAEEGMEYGVVAFFEWGFDFSDLPELPEEVDDEDEDDEPDLPDDGSVTLNQFLQLRRVRRPRSANDDSTGGPAT